MRTFIRFTCFLMSFVILVACPRNDFEPDSEILIVNSSQDTIIYFVEFNSPGDTLVSEIPFPLTEQNTEHRLVPTNDSLIVNEAYKEIFDRTEGQLLMLYLFHKDTIFEITWQEIIDNNSILRRYDLTLEDLESMDWRIEYP